MKRLSLLLILCFPLQMLHADTLRESNALFDFAEREYPHYFSPAGAETAWIQGFLARYYADTDTYLGTRDSRVYVHGRAFGEGIVHLGEVSDYIDLPVPIAPFEESIEIEGRKRRFLINDFSEGAETALLIVLHGAGGNAESAAQMTGFDRVARRENLVVVYPQGSGTFGDALLTWNATHCCSYAMRNRVDDVTFIARLIDHVIATRTVDPARVYLTGLSNGGMLTHKVGYELAPRLAAIAPVIGTVFGDEPDAAGPLPALIVVGEEDTIVPPAGGPIGAFLPAVSNPADRHARPARDQADYWAGQNACLGREDSETEYYLLSRYTECRDDAEVIFYTVKGNGHAWPGGEAPRPGADEPVTHFDASEVIWEFFSRHTL